MLLDIKDSRQLRIIERKITQRGFDVIKCDHRYTLGWNLTRSPPSIVIVDVGHAKEKDLYEIRAIRSSFNGYIMAISASDGVQEHIETIKSGADDYIRLSDCANILSVRIDALYRRREPDTDKDEIISFADISVFPKTMKCLVGGKDISLTRLEFNLLKSLISSRGEIISRDSIYRNVLGREYNGVDRTADVRVSNLRKKVSAFSTETMIETVWGEGYLLSTVN